MAKQAYVYSGTDWVPLASEVTNLTAYQTKASNQFAHRNLIINGDMQVAQRGTSTASITASEYYTTDRWRFGNTTLGTWTMSQENDAPTGSGFRNSTKVLCTTADASPAAGDELYFEQRIEGQNLQQVKKGTAAAEQLTLSFWVKANVTGTYIAWLLDNDNTRSISASYTISTSATWEKKTITFPADTTGAFDNDNALSLVVRWYLGVGSNYTSGTLGTTWASRVNANTAVGQVNLASATNNYWQITGIQLEVGATATPFEFKPFAQDLEECQRYYEKSYPNATAPGTANTANFGINGFSTSSAQKYVSPGMWKVTKRANPDVTVYDYAGNSGKITTLDAGGTGTNNVNIAIIDFNDQGFRALGAGNGVQSGYTYHWVASSEL
jgi:hypothetical protein